MHMLILWFGLGAEVLTYMTLWYGIALYAKISGIPPLGKHSAGNTAYAPYRQRTSVLIPWPPKPGRP